MNTGENSGLGVPDREQGTSLVELMVSIVIAMLVTLIVTQAFLIGTRTQYAQNDLTRLQESGRFSLTLLQNEVGKAGFRDTSAVPPVFLGKSFGPTSPGTNGLNMIDGFDDGPSDPSAGTFATDRLTLRFYGENDPSLANINNNIADGRIFDCLGNAITRNTLVTETIFVAVDANNNNEPTLWCAVAYNSMTAGYVAPSGCPSTTCVPLIPGVESFQILYGEDTDGDGVVNRYVPIADVSTMANVLSVKVSLVVRSPVAGRPNPTSTTTDFNHFGTTYATGGAAPADDPGSVYTAPADGRYRQMLASIVALRNYAY